MRSRYCAPSTPRWPSSTSGPRPNRRCTRCAMITTTTTRRAKGTRNFSAPPRSARPKRASWPSGRRRPGATRRWRGARQRAERQRPAGGRKNLCAEKAGRSRRDELLEGLYPRPTRQREYGADQGDRSSDRHEERQCDQADFDLRTIIIDVRDRFDEMETRLNELEARMSKRRGAATPKCDATPRGFDLDRLR